MRRIVGEHHVCITRKLAREHLALAPVPGDRPLLKSRADMLREVIFSGDFYGNYFASAYCHEIDLLCRLNSKHTAYVFSDEATPLTRPDGSPYKVKVIEYECDTLVELAILNNQYDRSESSRNMNDSNRVFGNLVPALENVPAPVVNAIIRGITFWRHGPGYTKINKTQRGLLTLEYPGFCAFAAQLLTTGKKAPQFLRRTEVVAAIMGHYVESPERAIAFWTSVAGGDNAPDSKERQLGDYLREYAAKSKTGRQTRDRMVEAMVRCDRNWITWANANGPRLRRRAAKRPAQ